MSNLNVYCSTSHTGGHCSITFDLTPPLFYYERAKYVYSTELPQELYNRGGLPFSVPRNLRHCTQWKIIFLTVAFPHITQYPLLRNSFSVSPLLSCADFEWHHWIMSSVILSSFGNSTGCLQPSFKYDLRNLPPRRSTPSSSKKRSNWEIFEFPFSLPCPSLLQSLGLMDLISAANVLACTIFMISISPSLSKLLFIFSPWLSPCQIFFKSFLYLSTIATNLFILYQKDILLSRASRMSFPVEMQ